MSESPSEEEEPEEGESEEEGEEEADPKDIIPMPNPNDVDNILDDQDEEEITPSRKKARHNAG